MKIIRTSTNSYALSFRRECICYLSQELLNIIDGKSDITDIRAHQDSKKEDILYYKKKYEYLVKHGVLGNTYRNIHLAPIFAEHVESSFYNTPELVFEVTESCNMRCSYCVYGGMYNNAVNRSNSSLTADMMLNAIHEILDRRDPKLTKIMVGFYGGEPLLLFNEIKKVISCIDAEVSPFKVCWLMTTNATLLTDEVADFCCSHNIDLLISLDGNSIHNKYRVFNNGMPTYELVTSNIKKMQKRHPSYFQKKVSFSSVHATDARIPDIETFFENEYKKRPLISMLTTIGAKDDTISKATEHQTNDEVKNWNIDAEMISFVHNLTHNISTDITSMLHRSKNNNGLNDNQFYFRPSGTCFPFGKKIFITAKGVIKPCEKVPLDFSLGTFNGEHFIVSFSQIAEFYNHLYEQVWNECRSCGNLYNCSYCIWSIPNILSNSRLKCPNKTTHIAALKKYGIMCNYLEETPEVYRKYIDIHYE